MLFWYFSIISFWNDEGELDAKLWYLIIAFCFGVASYVTYLLDLKNGHTSPHPVSWTVWLITQVIATYSSFHGGGGYGAAYGVFYCFTISSILLYTLKKRKWESIEKSDWICLAICLGGIIFWMIFNTPLIGLAAAVIVDAYAFWPSIVKVNKKPWSESLWGWGLMIPNGIFTMMALEEYNWFTLPYPLVMLTITIILVILCWLRRKTIPEPELESEH